MSYFLKNNPEKKKSDFLRKEIRFRPFFSQKKKELFYTEMGLLLKASIPLKESISLLIESSSKKEDRSFYLSILEQLNSGDFFYESLQKQENVSSYEWNVVKIGEETGELGQVVQSLAYYFKRKNNFRQTLTSALAYPILLLLTACIVIIFMLTTIVPLFEGVFSQQGLELPLMTKAVIKMAGFLKKYGLLMLFLGAIMIFLFRIIYKKPKVKQWGEQFIFSLPIIGAQLRVNYSFQFSQTMYLLTKSQVTLSKSLGLMSKMFSFYPLQKALHFISQEIQKGNSFGTALKATSFFDQRIHSFIHVGEETHQLKAIFEELSLYYEEKMTQRSKRFASLLEPLIIVLVGMLIGLILVSMYLPMFQLSTTLS